MIQSHDMKLVFNIHTTIFQWFVTETTNDTLLENQSENHMVIENNNILNDPPSMSVMHPTHNGVKIFRNLNLNFTILKIIFQSFSSLSCHLSQNVMTDCPLIACFSNKIVLSLGFKPLVLQLRHASLSLHVNTYEIVLNFFHISRNLTWYSATAYEFTRIHPVCLTCELTKQFM